MRKDQEIELRRIQEMALDHAINEMDEAHGKSLDTAEDRGDRHWFTKMASGSIKVAAQIENFILLRNRPGMYDALKRQEENEKAADDLVKRAQAKILDIKGGKRKSA